VTRDFEFEEAEREALAEQLRLLRKLSDEERLACFLSHQPSEAWPTALDAGELRRAIAWRDRERDEVARRLADALG
jgi:hypothetical protein